MSENTGFRPAAVPLVTVDPYFSIWSANDRLNDGVTRHWTGRRNPMTAGVVIDDQIYILMGERAADSDRRAYGFYPIVPQVSLEITPTRTIYCFENESVRAQLIFTSPLLLDNLKVMTRPVSYIEYSIKVIDGKQHKLSFYFDISAECCVDGRVADVTVKRTKSSLCCGNVNQKPLSATGDMVCIDWGYLHLADKDAKLFDGSKRREAANDSAAELPEKESYSVFDEYPCLGVLKNEPHGVVTLAYDDIKAIEYFGKQYDGYYRNFYGSFDEMLEDAAGDYDRIKKLCEEFDGKLTAETKKINDKYEKITSLAYRQAIAAHKLISDEDGRLVFLSKECYSNGCIGTLDVTYPSIPLFLKFNPELVNAMLTQIFKYALSEEWTCEFAPHDVGRYPVANGQVYGVDRKTLKIDMKEQMPVEECGNALLCLAAAEKYGADRSAADENKELLKQWADYLVKCGYDPGHQLCTDDFAGHLEHNCNLSLKAILGIASYGRLFSDGSYIDKAKELAARWQLETRGKKASRLAFDIEDSWSLKYNIIWDKLLGFNLFDEKVFRDEVELYKEKVNTYGIPLDSRADYGKVDWMFWTTVMTDDKEYLNMITDAVYEYVNGTADRVPFSDWYYTSIGRMVEFQNRSVLGGIFINII